MVQKRKEIKDLQTDLEVINPIESKKILGGDWYTDRWADGRSDGNGGMVLTFHEGSGGNWASGAGTFGGTYDPFYDGSYTSDWYNYGNDNTGGGGDSGQDGLPNLPTTVEKQLGSMGACVSYAMAFMSSYLGRSITGANMALQNALKLNLSMGTTMIAGLTIAEASQAIQSYFFTTTLTSTAQIINAVETNQHGVLTNVYVTDSNGNNIPNLGHEVVIVDYDPATGTFTAADSTTGAYETYYSNQINLGGGIYEITGVKP